MREQGLQVGQGVRLDQPQSLRILRAEVREERLGGRVCDRRQQGAQAQWLVESAVEELLRFEGPVETATERYALEDVLICGTTIPRGALVYVVLASANRDERQFDNPDTLDITRQNNRHLAFGQGLHFCLGAPLARLEPQIAINALLQGC